jgi:branched-chain amino acid aminotransferase
MAFLNRERLFFTLFFHSTLYSNKNTICALDGQFLKAKDASANFYAQSLHYGNGVFEGIRAYETHKGVSIFKAEAHYERLIHSAKVMHLPIRYSVKNLVEMSYELLEKNGFTDAYIRPLLFTEANMSLNSSQRTHLFMAAWPWEKLFKDKIPRLMISSYQRPNPKGFHVEAKVCGHYVNSILATNEARRNGYDDGVMLDMDGYVAEASGANIFYEKNEVLYTPSLGHILPGITRATVMELCQELKIKLVEKRITVEELKNADGIFLAGTAAEITQVDSIDGQSPVMRWEDTYGFVLQKKYEDLVRQRERSWTLI